jgi:Zn-finger nucleic acid-binding protein
MATVPALAEAHRHLHALHCATCGAARSDETARACRFCSAAFRDEDLRRDTVCPGCYARIDGDARFCDHCGVAIAPTPLVTSPSTLTCPACGEGTRLRGRELGEPVVRVDECAACGGMWLGAVAFEQVLARARASAPPDARVARPAQHPAPRQTGGPLYRPCPQCATLMNRSNYGRSSGVIVDTCKSDGMWFDADELARVIAWIHRGGPDRQREVEREREAARRRDEDLRRSLPRPAGGRTGFGSTVDDLSGVDIAIDVLAIIFRAIVR